MTRTIARIYDIRDRVCHNRRARRSIAKIGPAGFLMVVSTSAFAGPEIDGVDYGGEDCLVETYAVCKYYPTSKKWECAVPRLITGSEASEVYMIKNAAPSICIDDDEVEYEYCAWGYATDDDSSTTNKFFCGVNNLDIDEFALVGDEGQDELFFHHTQDSYEYDLYEQSGNPSTAQIRGMGEDDHLHGSRRDSTNWAESLYGGDDDDVLYGHTGGDALHGEDGDDDLHAGPGNDEANGGPGSDWIQGCTGVDTIYGNAGIDYISLGDGTSAENAYGGPDGDYICGDDGPDDLDGGTGSDLVWGGAGTDTADGGLGTNQCDAETETNCGGGDPSGRPAYCPDAAPPGGCD